MAFEQTKSYLETYFKNKHKSSRNLASNRWFSSEVATISTLFEKCDIEEDDSNCLAALESKNKNKIVDAHLKLALTASLRNELFRHYEMSEDGEYEPISYLNLERRGHIDSCYDKYWVKVLGELVG